MNKKILLEKINGLDLKYKRSLHKAWCDANGATFLTVSSSWGCFGCIKTKKKDN